MVVRLLFLSLLAVIGCTPFAKLTESELEDGDFLLVEKGPDGKTQRIQAYLERTEDSVMMVPVDKEGNALKSPTRVKHGQVYVKPAFDIDVLVVLFKYRPGLASIPSQLNTDFNGNIYFGYRRDWYTIKDYKTPFGLHRRFSQKAISVGGFVGIGTTYVSPWTTNYQITDEYSGFILSKGLCLMLGLRSVTAGISIGWDNLVDRDKDVWVYQFHPWYGITFSINLN